LALLSPALQVLPALLVLAAVFIDRCLRRLQREVRGDVREVEKKGLSASRDSSMNCTA
jgi:hypothetical protein